ncbi:hypothetical protein AAHC03_01024 [Spirometra sp. Aus1]|nr:unnamed protein product [Spirometra erinaceieuropaei]
MDAACFSLRSLCLTEDHAKHCECNQTLESFLEGHHLPMSSVPGVVVEPSAYHAMLVQTYLDPDKEVCGLLFGQLEPGSVRVLGHLPSEATNKDPTSWAKALELGKEMMNGESGEPVRLVGWYHTHIGRGCEPTLSDLFLQTRLQSLLPHFVGLVLTAEGTSVSQPTRKIQLSAFMASNRRQAITLNVQIRPAMKASTALRHRLATSSLMEIMRLSSSVPSERLSQLCQDARIVSINLVIDECRRWNASVSGAIVENVDFVKQAFDLGLV